MSRLCDIKNIYIYSCILILKNITIAVAYKKQPLFLWNPN